MNKSNNSLLKDLVLTFMPDRYVFKSYSQQAEDLAIERYFKKRKGFYVDIGAYHPVIFSNTYLFYKKGWRGINIEPNPDHFVLFRHHRKKDINLNIAINKSREKLVYYKFNAPTVNTFDQQEAERFKETNGYLLTDTVEMQTYPLREVLEEHLTNNQPIDFMSIDVEGLDLNVLESNDWERFRPEMLLVEDNDIYNHPSLRESGVFSFLIAQGYTLWCISGVTMIFVRKD